MRILNVRMTCTWIALSVAVVIPSACQSSAPSVKDHGGRVLQAHEVQFEEIAPFVQMAGAWGDRSSMAHGTFGLFPGEATSPPHTHSQAYHAVVLSGTMTNPFGTESDATTMTAGSYWYVPAGEEHVTACVSAERCLFYFHADHPFDFAPIDTLTAARSAGAVTTQADQIQFEEIAPFVQMAGAWGDRSSMAHGTFGLFKAGAASPPHTHSGAYHAVVLSGTMTNPFGDQKNPPEMTRGSYWYVPGGVEHVTACISAEPCLFYFHAEEAFDFTPTEQ